MNSRIPILLLAVLALTVSAVMADPTGTTGTISGCLNDARTGLPVTNAKVTIIESGQSLRTDLSGCFEFLEVPPGTYHLLVTHVGLGTFKDLPELTVTVEAGRASRVTVVLGKSPKNEKEKKGKSDPSSDLNESEAKVMAGEQSVEDGATSTNERDERGRVSAALQSPLRESVAGFERRDKCAPSPDYRPYWDEVEAPEDMFFRDYGTNGFVDPRRDPFSTFALDVDDASYNIVRRYLQEGHMPPQDAVRIEEFINHFNYGYNTPANETFRVFTEITDSPFERDRYLLKLAVKGREVDEFERKALRLTFVVDVSGSMAQGNRFELVRESIKALARQLDHGDRVGIVAYGSHAFEVLAPVPGDRISDISRAVDRLRVGGSTYAEAGIRLGYEMADRQYVAGVNNVIVLCSDGVANVGRTSPEEIMREVQRFARQGITLSTFGYGMGNYNDVLLEQLAVKGNGRYAYINDRDDIRTAMVDGFVSNVQVLARDVKVQVEFNPKAVAAYRLLGYENRAVADHKFRDDRQDGGEVGAGHEVTVMYELELNRGARKASLATVHVRWKNSSDTRVFELDREARMGEHYAAFERIRPETRLAAVAGRFAELLKGTGYADESFAQLYRLAEPLRRDLPGEPTEDLLDLIRRAGNLSDRHADYDDRDDDDYYGDFNYKR